MVSEMATWFLKAVNQNSGIPVTFESSSFSSVTSEIRAPSSSSSSSSESAACPASTSASVGSALPAIMASRRSYNGAYLSRNCRLACFPYVTKRTTCLLLQHENGHLELALDLGVLDLNTLQAVNPSSDRRGKRLDVAGRAANELIELLLSKSKESRVLLSAKARL